MANDPRAAVRLSAPATGGSAVRDRTWGYVVVCLAMWAFMPEVRRLIDWRIGFEPIPITAVLPLVSLVPFVVLVARRWDRVPNAMRVITWLWCGGFAYAFAAGIIGADPVAAAYTFAGFVLPVFVGAWASSEQQPADALSFFAKAALGIAAVSSAYGLFQYVAPPPWDAYWMNIVGNILGGYPIPFQVRVFGTLNSAGPFANFVTMALILTFSRRRLSFLTVLQIVVCVAALGLSLVRSSWLTLVIGIIVYAIVSRRAVRIVQALAICSALVFIAGIALPAIVGNQSVASRFSTLGDIGADQSANNRLLQIEAAFQDVVANPLGHGLGVIGTATKLSTVSQSVNVLDSGYLSRLVEMGFPGFAAYLAAIGIAIAMALFVPRAADAEMRNLCALCAAIQIALVFLDLGGDSRLGFMGMFCWIPTGLALGALNRSAQLPDSSLAKRIARANAFVPKTRATS